MEKYIIYNKDMYYLLKLKKIVIKLLTFWIFQINLRKNARNFLFYFSFKDYIKFKHQNFHIVSLGNDCMPRVLTTAIKLKPRKIYGKKHSRLICAEALNLQKLTNSLKTISKIILTI